MSEADIEAARQRHDAEWKIGPPRLAPLIVTDGTGKRPEPDTAIAPPAKDKQ